MISFYVWIRRSLHYHIHHLDILKWLLAWEDSQMSFSVNIYSFAALSALLPFHLTVLSKEYSRILEFKEPVPNKALNGHLIRAEKVADEGSCRVFCYLEPNCVSINVGPQEDGGRICELNSKTDGSSSLSALRQKNQYTYYGIEVWDKRIGLLI